ncbi:hypothetical protein FGO68_gene17311 [Halteria grandinella]|uniref:Uncharacterized protein n=1 Tax=Halteria grandinella TaxID=5974 RepID=A0A8J8NFU0_HALGN|nr:hypothetical protein FGO68_gene17311 [Halteria grandinella]
MPWQLICLIFAVTSLNSTRHFYQFGSFRQLILQDPDKLQSHFYVSQRIQNDNFRLQDKDQSSVYMQKMDFSRHDTLDTLQQFKLYLRTHFTKVVGSIH